MTMSQSLTQSYTNLLNEEEIKDYIITVTCEHAKVRLAGVIDAESISLPMGANYSSSLATQGLEGGIKGVFKAGLTKMFGNISSGIVDQFHSINSTINTYESSNRLSFSLSMNIYIGKFGNPKKVTEILRQIALLTQPDIRTNGNLMFSHLYDPSIAKELINPLSKTPNFRIFDKSLICVTIGDWFKTCGLYLTSSTPEISTIIDMEGKPLYIKWTCSFESYRVLTADDVAKMIKV